VYKRQLRMCLICRALMPYFDWYFWLKFVPFKRDFWKSRLIASFRSCRSPGVKPLRVRSFWALLLWFPRIVHPYRLRVQWVVFSPSCPPEWPRPYAIPPIRSRFSLKTCGHYRSAKALIRCRVFAADDRRSSMSLTALSIPMDSRTPSISSSRRFPTIALGIPKHIIYPAFSCLILAQIH